MVPLVVKDGINSWMMYVVGAALYTLVARFVHKPLWFYVWGHELTHAFTGLLSGAKIHSIKANSHGGEVRLSKANLFVALSPYIVPFYAILVLVTYAIIRHFYSHLYMEYTFQFLLGLSLAFHVHLTWEAVHRKQPDLKIAGFFLSGVLIVLGNTLILSALAICFFTKTPSFKEYGWGVAKDTTIVWKKGAEYSLIYGDKLFRHINENVRP